jgi:hypothetical protein
MLFYEQHTTAKRKDKHTTLTSPALAATAVAKYTAVSIKILLFL